jgi:hypothetical protein
LYKLIKMKTFKDLVFKEHPNHLGGVQATIYFDNGYGASIVSTPYTYGGKEGLYELAVFGKNGHITYDTPVTNDVEGYLSEDDVTNLLEKIQQL